MMRFNGSGAEVPASGESRAEPSFEARVLTAGTFIARIKRAGKRSKQMGWVEILLLENDSLAICSDPSTDSDCDATERFLLFPVFDNASFRQVKRHGNALTLMATSFSIVLEAEAGDDLAATQTTKWARIIQRLTTGEASKNSAYFNGLGINLNTLSAKAHGGKFGRKQLLPLQATEPEPQRPQNQPLAAGAKHERAPVLNAERSLSSGVVREAGADRVSGRNVATGGSADKASKRLSLGLAKPAALSLDMGFGEDLKGILGALEPGASNAFTKDVRSDEEAHSEPTETINKLKSTAKDSDSAAPEASHEDLMAPLAPFSDTASRTPSPSSLYLTQNPSPSASSLTSSTGKELNRVESILVKEQQQQLDRYGTRAATMSSFDLSIPPKPPVSTSSSSLATDTIPVPSNPPPGIPPPVPEERQALRVAKRVSIAQTSPAVQYISRDDESNSDSEVESTDAGEPELRPLPSPEPTPRESAQRKKNPGIVKVVKKLWGKRRVPKEQFHEFKGPLELRREQEEEERQLYEISRHPTPPLVDEDEVAEKVIKDMAAPASHSETRSAVSEWRALAAVEEEPETQDSSEAADNDAARPIAQAVAPTSQTHTTSAVPKLNSQSSISALSFRSMRSQGSLSSGLTAEEPAKLEAPKVAARLDPKQDASWQHIVEQHTRVPEAPIAVPAARRSPPPSAPPPAVPKHAIVEPVSLDPGHFTTPDRTTNPIIRKVFESANKSTPALTKSEGEGQHSTSSSYSSMASFKRSAPSYGSQASSLSSISYSNSASSLSAPNLMSPQKQGAFEMTVFGTSLWVSKWVGTKWTPLSQLELRTDIVATSSGVRVLVMNPGGVGCISIRFTPQCEVRRVSAHDTELKTGESTYMFRARDPENSHKFYRSLAALHADGITPSVATLPQLAVSEHDRSDNFDTRRRTLVPPVLSRTNYAPKYVGMSTSTIVEE